MQAAFRAFMSRIIDYAGLFPPASLSLEPAVRNYAKYRSSQEAWMLSRFICPVSRLNELDPLIAELFSADEPLPLSVLGRAVEGAHELIVSLEEDVESLDRFREKHSPKVAIDAFEFTLPDDVGRLGSVDLQEILARVSAVLVDRAQLRTSLEARWSNVGESSVRTVIDALATLPAAQRDDGMISFKLRCGGVVPAAFPSVPLVARTLRYSRTRGLACKFTAGLHHPLRRFDDSVETRMHGFFNVFGAAVLTHACDLEVSSIERILLEEDPAAFSFSDEGFSYSKWNASVDEIKQARRAVALSFGSCSFDEPREDLACLGYL